MKMQSAGKSSKRIIAPDGTIVGYALELANGRWAPFDPKDQRLVQIHISFQNPNEVLKFFKAAAAGPAVPA